MNPPFHADHVGSLLRPKELKDAFRRHREGDLDDDSFRSVQDRAIGAAVALQERVGLRSITDGEFRRPSYWASFVAAVDGLSVAEAMFEFHDGESRSTFTAPQVTGPVRRTGPITLDELAFLQGVTGQTPKLTLPSPSTMHFWRGPAALAGSGYESPVEFFADLARVYQEEIADLAAHGGTYIQLDEVALAMLCDSQVRAAVTARGENPEELVDLYVSAINQAVAQRPANIIVAMHLCRGNYKGRWMASGGYAPVAEKVFGQADVDALFLEFDSARAGDLRPLRFVPADKAAVLGLITSKSPELEDRDDLMRRIDEATEHLPLDRLALSPQCGFASTAAGNPVSIADQERKLSLVVEVADEVWGPS